MPYITKERRDELDCSMALWYRTPINAGELNYLITKLILNYKNDEIDSYQKMNDVVGALECAKQEYYRRVIVPYEEKKIRQNGDIAGYPESGLV